MISRWARTWITKIYNPFLKLLCNGGITANQLTISSLVFAILCGIFATNGKFIIAGFMLVLSGLCDSLDGELARFCGKSTKLGSFLDSIFDHYGDFAVYLGILLYGQRNELHITVLLVFTTMFGSVIGSQIRSRAGMLGIDTKNIGIFTRMERTLVLLILFLTGWITPMLALLALATNLSALQRFIQTLQIYNHKANLLNRTVK